MGTALLDQLATRVPGQHPKFVALAQALTAHYPCICASGGDKLELNQLA